MKAILRTLLRHLFKLPRGDWQVRRASMRASFASIAAAHLIAWALGLHLVLAWAFMLPIYCLLYGVWLWRVRSPAS